MILDGKGTAQNILEELKSSIAQLQGRKPCLAVILTGENPASQIYVNRKIEACANVGISSRKIALHSSTTQEELLQEVEKLNEDEAIDGILVQLPLPSHINPHAINLKILPDKDVDGFHPYNMGKLLLGQTDGFQPCTPLGILTLLQRYQIELTGKNAVVLGRSNIVGKPLAVMLMQNTPTGNATVTLAHKHTRSLKEICLNADLLVVAIGNPRFVTADMVKEGSIVVDVGINAIENRAKPKGYEIVGDVDFEKVKEKCAWITPVPNGIGPMTIAMLLCNTLKSFTQRK